MDAFSHSADIRRDNGKPAGHGLEYQIGEGLPAGWHGKNSRIGEKRGGLFRGSKVTDNRPCVQKRLPHFIVEV